MEIFQRNYSKYLLEVLLGKQNAGYNYDKLFVNRPSDQPLIQAQAFFYTKCYVVTK